MPHIHRGERASAFDKAALRIAFFGMPQPIKEVPN